MRETLEILKRNVFLHVEGQADLYHRAEPTCCFLLHLTLGSDSRSRRLI